MALLNWSTSLPQATMKWLQVQSIEKMKEAGIDSYNQSTDSVSAVTLCQKIIAENLGRTKFTVENSNDKKIQSVLKKPNSYQTMRELLEAWETDRLDEGNAYGLIIRRNGEPTAIEYIKPSRVQSARITKRKNLYYEIEGFQKPVKSEDILHFKGITRDDEKIFGLGLIQAAIQDVEINFATSKSSVKHYNEGMLNNRFLKVTNKIPVEPHKQKNSIDEFVKNGGAAKAGQIQKLPTNTEVINAPSDFGNSGVLEARKFSASQIAAMHGIPLFMLNMETSMKLSNMEQMILQFKLTTMDNIIAIYEDQLTDKLVDEDSPATIERVKDFFRGVDVKTKAEIINKFHQMGVISGNMAAHEFGWPKYEGGEKRVQQMQYKAVNDKDKTNSKKYETE